MANTQLGSTHFYQRPGALRFDSTRTSLAGDAEGLQFGKVGGNHLIFQTNIERRSPGFEVNDLGYLRRADQLAWSTWAGYFDRHTRRLYQRFQWNFNWWQYWTTAGLPEERAFNTNTHTTFGNQWSLHFGGTGGQLGTTYCYACARGGPAGRQDFLVPPLRLSNRGRRAGCPALPPFKRCRRGSGGRTRFNLWPRRGIRNRISALRAHLPR